MVSRSVACIAILAMAALIAGCIAGPSRTAGASDPAMRGIDAALERGPVFVEFGAPWCQWCNEEKPVVEQLSKETRT